MTNLFAIRDDLLKSRHMQIKSQMNNCSFLARLKTKQRVQSLRSQYCKSRMPKREHDKAMTKNEECVGVKESRHQLGFISPM